MVWADEVAGKVLVEAGVGFSSTTGVVFEAVIALLNEAALPFFFLVGTPSAACSASFFCRATVLA